MAETQEKIELLKKIAHRFHAAQIEWALGASMMLYFKGLSPAFHDIDLMVSEQDVERAGAILSEMGKLCPPCREPDPRYRTKVFLEFTILRIWTAGGDGTFMEAMTGVQGFANAAVGCLPYGSGNDFLRTYGTREEFTDLDAQLAGGEVTIDLLETSLGLSATICAAGLDAQVAYGIPKFRRIPLCGGEVSYLLSIVEQLCGHIGRRVTFTIDDEELTVDCLMCAICNGRAYGGGFLAAPEADPADGWLDVMIVRRVGRLTIAKLLGMYKSGRHFVNGQLTEEAKPYFLYRRARRVALRPADGRGPIVATADGECAPCDAVEAVLRPLSGRILLPAPAYERFVAKRSSVDVK